MVSGKKTAARDRIKKIIPDLKVDKHLKASEFIYEYWRKYQSEFKQNASIDGKVFEEMIAITLIRKGVFPFYIQAKAAFVNNAMHDFIIYTSDIGPISLSVKISLRERWKQADLEALALKNVHRSSESYVITLNHKEAMTRNKKMSECMAIDRFILADAVEYDDLLDSIKNHRVAKAKTIEVITCTDFIDKDNYGMWYT